ncbi:MAG TPA: hypothetical protein VM286_05355 [Candidatus Thermoplasmatota archaeon]|nr:hypothetical protein [Candidatus Thermoplasmatota archaeon]
MPGEREGAKDQESPTPGPQASPTSPPAVTAAPRQEGGDDPAPGPRAAQGLPSARGEPAAAPPRRLSREATLRDRIVEHLREHDHDSISGIARALSDGRRAPIHRLTVAGYLQAMAEAGTLRELDRPPSKEYKLANPEAHWSLHQRVHRALEDSPRPEAERARLALAVLQTLLGRPVFQAELQHAGFAQVPAGLDKVVVGDAVRRGYRDLFSRRASPRIDVPPRDPLYALPGDDPLLGSAAAEELMRKVLVKATGAEHLMADRPAGPAQAQLSLGGAA